MKALLWLATATAFAMGVSPAFGIPVIPGAAGFGMQTPAGRGGVVYRVTNLNDSGAGSLRDCIESVGPRVCIFEVSGTIVTNKKLGVQNPYLTIAGQTAPSPGITIRGAGISVASTHDVLIQHVRIRVGDDPNGPDPENRGGFTITAYRAPAYNIVADHLSISWAIDENVTLWYPDVSDVTIRNSISSEALHDSLHPKGPHSMGLIIGNDIKRVSIISSLLANNNARNPRTRDGSATEFVNNVVYNWGSEPVIHTEGNINVIGNVFKKGLDSRDSYVRQTDYAVVYARDNIDFPFIGASSPGIQASDYVPMDGREVYEYVLVNAGARPADRDSVDKRLVNGVKNGTGGIIDSQEQVAGWPSLPINRRPLTLPERPHDDDNGNGYTNLEEWLHSFAREVEGLIHTDRPNPPKLNPIN